MFILTVLSKSVFILESRMSYVSFFSGVLQEMGNDWIHIVTRSEELLALGKLWFEFGAPCHVDTTYRKLL